MTLITPQEARCVVLKTVMTLPVQLVPLEGLAGRVLAQDIVSPLQLPPFDNSSMDGYALPATALDGASRETPVLLQRVRTIAAGASPGPPLAPRTCAKIMTGAPLPEGADAVVMHEETSLCENRIKFTAPVTAETNVRRAGNDVRRGEVILSQGTQLQGPHWALLAALGVKEAVVTKRPRVGVIITGEELVTSGGALQEGQIYESNSYALRVLLDQAGVDLQSLQRGGDSAEQFESALRQAATNCDVIISTGGVSSGDFDPVRDVLIDKSTVHFWKVAMKPGKPVLFASWEGVPVFGLPGNPGSMLVTFEEFVRPALLKMAGRKELLRTQIEVEVATSFASPSDKTEFVPAQILWRSGEKSPLAQISAHRHSGRLATSVAANALLEVPTDVTFVSEGDRLFARLLYCTA